jgi:hypothetical protein
MSNLTSNLKQWGSQGSEYPDGYKFLDGKRAIDAWNNFIQYHTIEEIHALQSTVNDRLESDTAATHPDNPEVGHLSHRTDSPGDSDGEHLFYRDGTNESWHRLFMADGDSMEGPIDMNGNELRDGSGVLTLAGPVSVNGADQRYDTYQNYAGGTVATGQVVNLQTFGLEDGEQVVITQASLTEDGFTSPCPDGIDLVVYSETDYDNPGSATPAAVLSGDGATLYDDETGSPELTTVENTSGSYQTYAIGLDNGYFGNGVGTDQQAFGSFIGRVV